MNDNGRLTGKWLGLTLDATDAQARAAFLRKHGYEAQQVHRGKVLVYVGPIGCDKCQTEMEATA